MYIHPEFYRGLWPESGTGRPSPSFLWHANFSVGELLVLGSVIFIYTYRHIGNFFLHFFVACSIFSRTYVF